MLKIHLFVLKKFLFRGTYVNLVWLDVVMFFFLVWICCGICMCLRFVVCDFFVTLQFIEIIKWWWYIHIFLYFLPYHIFCSLPTQSSLLSTREYKCVYQWYYNFLKNNLPSDPWFLFPRVLCWGASVAYVPNPLAGGGRRKLRVTRAGCWFFLNGSQ